MIGIIRLKVREYDELGDLKRSASSLLFAPEKLLFNRHNHVHHHHRKASRGAVDVAQMNESSKAGILQSTNSLCSDSNEEFEEWRTDFKKDFTEAALRKTSTLNLAAELNLIYLTLIGMASLFKKDTKEDDLEISSQFKSEDKFI